MQGASYPSLCWAVLWLEAAGPMNGIEGDDEIKLCTPRVLSV